MALKKTNFKEDEEAIFDNAVIYKRGEYWHMRMWLPKEHKYARFSLKTRNKSTAKDKAELHYHELKVLEKSGKTYFSHTTKIGVEMYLEERKKDVEAGIIVKGRFRVPFFWYSLCMYLPQQFNHPQHAAAIMREHPFASLVSNDGDGFPFVTHLPLKLIEEGGQPVALLGHCARANPHAGFLQARPQALVTFMGPQAYMSPAVYPDLLRVPTWTYLAVHARVEARMLDGNDAKDAMLKQMIADHEPAYAAQWRGLPESYAHGMLNGIVAFELKILDLKTKVKINQHRPESHAAMHDAYAKGGEQEQALAQWMQRLGMVA